MHPENCADELNRLARILSVDGDSTVDPLPTTERENYQHRLEELLSEHTTYATIVCSSKEAVQFLEVYTEGSDQFTQVRKFLEQVT